MGKTFRTRISESECSQCHSHELRIINFSDTVDFRGIELDVENLRTTQCANCAKRWITEEQREHNDAIIREAYGIERDRRRAEQGLLSGNEIALIRSKFGLNQREAAKLFGGGYNAFNKYESGEVLQSAAMDRLLRLVVAVGAPAIEFLRDVMAPPSFIVIRTAKTVERRIQLGAIFEEVGGPYNEVGSTSGSTRVSTNNIRAAA